MKDLRAQRWLVAAWAATFVAAGSIEALKLDLAIALRRSAGVRLATSVFFLIAVTVFRPVLGWLLAVRIVNADPVNDASAFWLTRPLSPAMLLASKLGLMAFLFFVVPGLEAAVVFMANDVAPARLPAAIVQWWFFDAVLLLPFVLLATLTRDRARVGLATVVGAFTWAWLVGFATYIHSVGELDWSPWASVYRTTALTWMNFGIAIAALSAALVAWQYLTRRTAVTAWAALASVVTLAAVAALPSVQLRWRVERPEFVIDNRWDGARGVSVSIPPASVANSSLSNQTVRLMGDAAIAGDLGDVLIDIIGGRGTLRIPGRQKTIEGTDVNWFGFSRLARLALRTQSGRRVFERAIGARLIGPSYQSWNALSLVRVPQGDYTEYRGMQATYQADLILAAYRAIVSPAIPLTPGQATGVGQAGVTLWPAPFRPAPFRPGARGCWQAVIRESAPRAFAPPKTLPPGYLLRNQRRGEAVFLLDYSDRQVAQGLASTFLDVSVGSIRLDCGATGTNPVDDAWLADAELVAVSLECLGTFRKHVVVPEFTMPAVAVRER